MKFKIDIYVWQFNENRFYKLLDAIQPHYTKIDVEIKILQTHFNISSYIKKLCKCGRIIHIDETVDITPDKFLETVTLLNKIKLKIDTEKELLMQKLYKYQNNHPYSAVADMKPEYKINFQFLKEDDKSNEN